MSDGGKGSAPRPFSVSQEKFASNWDTIFGRRDKKPESDLQVNKNGELEKYREQYWQPVDNNR